MSTTSSHSDRDDALAAEYVLGTLAHDARAAFEQRLRSDAALQQRVAWWNEQMLPMGDEIAPVEPPARVLEKVEARLFAAETASAGGWWQSLSLWRGLAGAMLAVAVVFGAMLLNGGLEKEAPGQDLYLAQLTSDKTDVRVVAMFDKLKNTMRISHTAGLPAPSRDFELWVIVGDSAPVSIGVMGEGQTYDIVLPAEFEGTATDKLVLAVTDEPDGGSPSGKPTGDVVAAGQLAAF